jgi:hypothetical protein
MGEISFALCGCGEGSMKDLDKVARMKLGT